jgi:vacuolar-type H+-ATPase subunit F/Vma7
MARDPRRQDRRPEAIAVKAPVRAIARRPAALGLGLAGIPCIVVTDAGAASAALAALANGPAAGGVILIEQPLFDLLPPALHRQIRRDGVPILMPFPAPALDVVGPAPEEELLELLRRSIGYRLRLR